MKVLIEFDLAENVTPNIFARRVCEACTRYGAIRPGESLRSVSIESGVIFTQENMQHDLDEHAEIIRNMTKDDEKNA
jgi:hypothetical protein